MKRIFIFCLCLTSCSPVVPLENPFDKTLKGYQGSEQHADSKTLRILAIDVGQGDSTLMIGPSGKTLLVDAGPVTAGINSVLPTLASLSINHLDWILATHFDADHIGGISEVLKGPDQISNTEDDLTPLSGILDRGDDTDKNTPTYKNYLAEINSRERHTVTPGMKLELGHGAEVTAIVVNGHYSDGRLIHLNPDEENESCIGLLVTYGNFHYFTAGDLTGGGISREETKDMETTAGEIIGDIDILHVGHHGSRTSTNEHFLNLITPEAAVISVGHPNDYGHPAPSTLGKLQKIKATLYRTDQMGTIDIETDGNTYQIRNLLTPSSLRE